ncbi:hypothetical protein KG089_05685 [Carnobacteriaceae bacterium zg-ZUI252]|nr:hypothetical protein [Carnobacteriaceae bacterium zg-ZUI252]
MKKFISKLSIVILVLFGISIHCLLNLKSHSVYYAKHMPRGEGQKPELIMLIDNLYWIYTPDIEGIKYNFDGTNTFKNLDGSKRFGNIYSDETEYSYADGTDVSYRFNRKFELIHVMNVRKMEILDVSSVDKNKVIEEIEQFVKPVMEQQSEPMINLQWLFNLLYQDEFK